jgi:GTP pyrophosphokinase
MVIRAYEVAKREFREKRRDDDVRYFEHLRFVALTVMDYMYGTDADLIAAALLHDIVEDIPSWSVDKVKFEFNDRVAYFVDCVTKEPVEEYDSKTERNKAYHDRFTRVPREPIILKAADRLHNHMSMWVWEEDEIERKVEETQRYYMPLFKREMVLVHELEEAMQLLLDGKNPMTDKAAP